jgi:hypothetical protein
METHALQTAIAAMMPLSAIPDGHRHGRGVNPHP